MADAIVVQGLGKRFHRSAADRPHTLKEALIRGRLPGRSAATFWALRDVGFTVGPGRMLGVIGQNGAGKSTLLPLVGGVGHPDEGSVRTTGRLGALLDLTTEFHGDLTGRENVFISGVIAGLTRREVASRFERIVEFAELEQFIDSPVRTYSTGMQMRLAFAVAAHSEPDVLLIDEVLAVGDIAFQRKCLQHIANIRANGCAIMLVSHEPTLVRDLCDDVLWLRGGRVVAHGAADAVVTEYIAEMEAETRRRTPRAQGPSRTAAGVELRANENRFGSQELQIVGARLLDARGRAVESLRGGQPLRVEVAYEAPTPIQSPIFGVSISRADGLVCYDTSTAAAGVPVPTLRGRGTVTLDLERVDLVGGEYFVDVGAYERDWAYAYDYHWHAYPLAVHATDGDKGILRPPARWSLKRDEAATDAA